jgi:hypothetical protein
VLPPPTTTPSGIAEEKQRAQRPLSSVAAEVLRLQSRSGPSGQLAAWGYLSITERANGSIGSLLQALAEDREVRSAPPAVVQTRLRTVEPYAAKRHALQSERRESLGPTLGHFGIDDHRANVPTG